MSILRTTGRRPSVALTALLVATLTLTACQAGTHGSAAGVQPAADLPPLTSLSPIADPTSWEGPSTVVIGEPNFEPVAETPTQSLPATVTSLDGNGIEVTVTDTSRVLAISLTGTLAELVYSYGLADTLVGRDISTSLPGYEDLPVVTKSGHSVDAEAILALSPTLLITDGSIGPTDVVLNLREAGVTVVTVSRASDPESTYELARQVAAVFGVDSLADSLIAGLEQAIAEKESEISTLLPADEALRPRVAFLYIRGTAGVYYLFGEGSGIESIIESLGAVDVAKEIGWIGEKPMTDEALVSLDPDILLVMTGGLESAGGIDGLISTKPAVALTNAGKNRRIIDVPDTMIFAGGTRIPDILDGLARAIYAPDSL